MTEISKDFLKLIATLIVVLTIFLTILNSGILESLFALKTYAEPLTLLDHLAAAIETASSCPGECSFSVRTSGLPYILEIYKENGNYYASIDASLVEEKSNVKFLPNQQQPVFTKPLVSDCIISEQKLALTEGLIQDITIKKVLEDGTCRVFIESIKEYYDFNVSVDPDTLLVQNGTSSTTTVTVSLIGSAIAPGTVNLTVTGAPPGVTIALDKNDADPTFTSKMTVTADPTAAQGIYNLTITGTSGDLARTASLQIEVSPTLYTFILNSEISIVNLPLTNVSVNLNGITKYTRTYDEFTSNIIYSMLPGSPQTVQTDNPFADPQGPRPFSHFRDFDCKGNNTGYILDTNVTPYSFGIPNDWEITYSRKMTAYYKAFTQIRNLEFDNVTKIISGNLLDEDFNSISKEETSYLTCNVSTKVYPNRNVTIEYLDTCNNSWVTLGSVASSFAGGRFYDKFDKDRNNWYINNGTWNIANGELNNNGIGYESIQTKWNFWNSSSNGNNNLEVSVNLSSGGNLSIRIFDAINDYYLQTNDSYNNIYLWVNGALKQNVSLIGITPNQWNVWRIKQNDSYMEFYLNNKKLIVYNGVPTMGNGRIELRTHNTQAHFDNITAYDGSWSYNFGNMPCSVKKIRAAYIPSDWYYNDSFADIDIDPTTVLCKLTVNTQIDIPSLPLPGVEVNVTDGVLSKKYNKITAGPLATAVYFLAATSLPIHNITVNDTFYLRNFSHYWDQDCNSSNAGCWLDTTNNPYWFSICRDKNITVQYKTFTEITSSNSLSSSLVISTPVTCDSTCKSQGFSSGTCKSSCQSGETSIGQDGCSSGVCCCLQTTTILKHLVVYSYTINDTVASFIGSHFDLVDLDIDATGGFQKIKAANPNITMIGYKDFISVATYQSDWSMINQHEDWFLHDNNGNRVMAYTSYLMNISNSGWRNYVANWCANKLAANPLADGIFADNALTDALFDWGTLSVPKSSLPTDIVNNWDNYMIQEIQAVKSAIGSKLLVINSDDTSGLFIQYCNGQMIEHFMHRTYLAPNDWAQTNALTDMNWLDKLSATGKIVMAFSGATIPQNPTSTDIALTHQCMLYSLSGFLLSYSGKAGFSYQMLQYDYTGHNGYWPEMDAPIGNPIGKYYSSQNIYMRDFTGGKVLLNPSTSTYTINLGGSYKTLDGTTVSSITMNPHTGEILLKTVTSSTCDSQCKAQSFASGTCRTGTPDTNLAPMPGNWRPGGYGGGTQNLFIDYNVLSPSGKPSWRVEAYTDGNGGTPDSQRVGNYWRECISQNIPNNYLTNPMKVGDYIVVKVWVRTGPSTIGKNGVIPSSVVCIFDYYNPAKPADPNRQVREHNSNYMIGTEYACDICGNDLQATGCPGPWNAARIAATQTTEGFVPMNTVAMYPQTNGWVQKVLTGRIPSRILNYQGDAWSAYLPTEFIVACNAGSYQFWNSTSNMPYQDEGTVWFADAEVYINPTCQSEENSIGQDGCSSGLCCCMSTTPIITGNTGMINTFNFDFHVSPTISGYLLDEYGNPILNRNGTKHSTCTPQTSYDNFTVNRNVSLEYFKNESWYYINSTDSLPNGYWSYNWSCACNATKLRANYTPISENWFYMPNSTTINITCPCLLLVFAQVDAYDKGYSKWPLSPVQVNVSNVIKRTNASGYAEYYLFPGNYFIKVDDPFAGLNGQRNFSHFFDNDCNKTKMGCWFDTANNPYNFGMYDREKNITAQYKAFTYITDTNNTSATFEFNGTYIKGKLLDEKNESIINIPFGQARYTCRNSTLPPDNVAINRNVTLEVYNKTDNRWYYIGAVNSNSDGSWSYNWIWDPKVNKIRANYTPVKENWYYMGSSAVLTMIRLTVDTFRDDAASTPVQNVSVTFDGITKSSGTNGIAEFIIKGTNHNLMVEDPKNNRSFSHFWDSDCDQNNLNYYLDNASNPYNFKTWDMDRNITAYYKSFTNITNSAGANNIFDYDYTGHVISGKLLDERGVPIMSTPRNKHDKCEYGLINNNNVDVNRNVTLEYFDTSWHYINATDSLADGSWSYDWTCACNTTKIRANYTPMTGNWFYLKTGAEIGIDPSKCPCKLTVFTFEEIPNSPIPNVNVTLDSLPPNLTDASGKTEFLVMPGSHSLMVDLLQGDLIIPRLGHFRDADCSQATKNQYQDVPGGGGTYSFSMYDRDKNITAFYRTFAKLTDTSGNVNTFEYNGTYIKGKLLENGNTVLLASKDYYSSCGTTLATRNIDRDIYLEYYSTTDSNWHPVPGIPVTASSTDGSWMLPWTCSADATLLRATYTPATTNWWYTSANATITVICMGTLEVHAFAGSVEINTEKAEYGLGLTVAGTYGIGDVDWNGIVDTNDFNFVTTSGCNNKNLGDVGWNLDCDINRDDAVNGNDLILISKQNAKTTKLNQTPFNVSVNAGTYRLRAKYKNQIINYDDFIINPNQKTTINLYFSTCDGFSALNCVVPDVDHPGIDERKGPTVYCGRSNAFVYCDGSSYSKTVCDKTTSPGPQCSIMNPSATSYSVSSSTVSVGDPFSITVNSNCPGNLPGSCLVECRVIHPDRHEIDLDEWSSASSVTLPSITCNQAGSYTLQYCGVYTDFIANRGWGTKTDIGATINCLQTYPLTFTAVIDVDRNVKLSGSAIYVDNNLYTTGAGGTVTIQLTPGSHTVNSISSAGSYVFSHIDDEDCDGSGNIDDATPSYSFTMYSKSRSMLALYEANTQITGFGFDGSTISGSLLDTNDGGIFNSPTGTYHPGCGPSTSTRTINREVNLYYWGGSSWILIASPSSTSTGSWSQPWSCGNTGATALRATYNPLSENWYYTGADTQISIICKCGDGTPYGQCSATKPKYCNSGTLIDKCSQCGCSGTDQCQPDGTCTSPPPACASPGVCRLDLVTCNSSCIGRGYCEGNCVGGTCFDPNTCCCACSYCMP